MQTRVVQKINVEAVHQELAAKIAKNVYQIFGATQALGVKVVCFYLLRLR